MFPSTRTSLVWRGGVEVGVRAIGGLLILHALCWAATLLVSSFIVRTALTAQRPAWDGEWVMSPSGQLTSADYDVYARAGATAGASALLGAIALLASGPIARAIVPFRAPKLRCPACRYSLANLAAPRCPECGLDLPPEYARTDGPTATIAPTSAK